MDASIQKLRPIPSPRAPHCISWLEWLLHKTFTGQTHQHGFAASHNADAPARLRGEPQMHLPTMSVEVSTRIRHFETAKTQRTTKPFLHGRLALYRDRARRGRSNNLWGLSRPRCRIDSLISNSLGGASASKASPAETMAKTGQGVLGARNCLQLGLSADHCNRLHNQRRRRRWPLAMRAWGQRNSQRFRHSQSSGRLRGPPDVAQHGS